MLYVSSITRKFSGRDMLGNARGKMVVYKKDHAGLCNEGFSSEDLHGSIDSTLSAPDPSSANGFLFFTCILYRSLHKLIELPISRKVQI